MKGSGRREVERGVRLTTHFADRGRSPGRHNLRQSVSGSGCISLILKAIDRLRLSLVGDHSLGQQQLCASVCKLFELRRYSSKIRHSVDDVLAGPRDLRQAGRQRAGSGACAPRTITLSRARSSKVQPMLAVRHGDGQWTFEGKRDATAGTHVIDDQVGENRRVILAMTSLLV